MGDSRLGIIYDNEGIDCLSKNMLSRVTSPTTAAHQYDNITGSPVTSFGRHIIGESETMRLNTDYKVEFEYLR